MKSTYIENVENYLQTKNVPITQFINLGVTDKFFNKNEDSHAGQEGEIQISPTELLTNMFMNEEF